MALFKLQDEVVSETVLTDTHYYKWLESNKPTDIHKLITKLEYLEPQGFRAGLDTLTEDEARLLSYIEDLYFHNEIKPTLKNNLA